MKILHVSEALDKGGLEEVIYNLVKNTNEKRFDVRVASFRGGEVSNRLSKQGYLYYEITADSKKERIQELKKLIKREGFDVVQAHFCFEAITAAKACGVKVIETVHNTYGFFVNPWGKLKYSYYLNRADAIVTVSDAVKYFNEQHFYVMKPEKCVSIRNSINPDRLRTSSRSNEEIKQSLGIPEKSLVISTLSRLDVQKGLEYFIDMAKLLNEQFEQIAFVIPGEGNEAYSAQLKERANGIDNIHFIGHTPNINDLFKIMDIFVLSSLWEGGPLTLLEAMAYEKAIVATKVGNTEEVIRDGSTGFLVDSKDAAALAEKVGNLIQDEVLRSRLAEKAHDDFYVRFSNDIMIQKYKQLYETLA